MSVETSRDAFLVALENLLSVPDAAEPGINVVARRAGLNKVLLYRYFGSWDEFLAVFARRVNPWRDLRVEVEDGLAAGRWSTLTDVVKWLFRAYFDRLAGSPLLQNLLRLSIVHQDPLQAALERDRETEGLALMAAVTARFPPAPGGDPAAVAALVTGGITWLVLVGTRAGTFNGLSFQGPGSDARDRLDAVVADWAETLTKPLSTGSL